MARGALVNPLPSAAKAAIILMIYVRAEARTLHRAEAHFC
jgi:hypothetical protein